MTATDLDLDALLDALTARALERAQAAPLVNVAGQPVGPGLRATTGRLQVNPGDLIASVWGNTTYDQTVEVFDNASARDSQWPTPKDGAVCYLVDSATLWARRAGAWKGLPMGFVASIVGPSTAVNCGASITQLITMSPTLYAGRRYRVSGYVIGTNTAAAVARVDITGLDLGTYRLTLGATTLANGVWGAAGVGLVTPSSTGARAITMMGTATTGTYNVGANACELSIDDIGSNP